VSSFGRGLKSPHGLAFVKTSDDDDSLRDQIKDVCQKLLFGELAKAMSVKKAVSGRPSLF
jgi:hypothetical protein